MTDTNLISCQPKDKSFAENIEFDPIAWKGDISKNHTYTQALACRRCNSVVIAELEPEYGPTITIYEIDLYVRNQKVKHRHCADTLTRVIVLERIETEKRLLEDIDPGDYVYYKEAKGVN